MGRNSPQADKDRADDNVRRLDDQIRMIQYVRGRIGEDRDTILDMGRIPDYDARFPMPSTPLQGRRGTSERWQVPTDRQRPAEHARRHRSEPIGSSVEAVAGILARHR